MACTLHNAQRALSFGGLALTAVVLTGCQSLSSAGAGARVRVIDLSPDVQTVDIYHGASAVAYNLGFGAVTSYVQVAPGSSTFTVDLAGSRQVLSSLKGSFAAGAQYTVLIGGSAVNLQQTILADPPQQAPSSQPPTLRLVHEAARSGAVDVYCLAAGHRSGAATPLLMHLESGTVTTYLPVPAGVSSLLVLPAGMPLSAANAIHSGKQLRFSNGVARTLILADAPPSDPADLQVIMTAEQEP